MPPLPAKLHKTPKALKQRCTQQHVLARASNNKDVCDDVFCNTVHLIRWLCSTEDNIAGLESARRTQTESFRGGGCALVVVFSLQSQVFSGQFACRVFPVKLSLLGVPTVPQLIRLGAPIVLPVSLASAVFQYGGSHALVQASALKQAQESFLTIVSKVPSFRAAKRMAAVIARVPLCSLCVGVVRVLLLRFENSFEEVNEASERDLWADAALPVRQP